jgi:serine phosphatase RsbU (regulator of sigma subunit)
LGGYHFAAATLLNWLLLLTLAFTVVRRQLLEGRRQAHLEQEIRSAQEVQHVLIPEEIPSTPGLSVASVYKPAAEVGGDFFQVIPPEPDSPESGTLIIVGDVSGKGLKAAMTVSLIVGTLRTLADATRSPAAILVGLNRRLLGRTQGGFATCIVLRIDADGTATIANAGHLAPFRDGLEWEVAASLPLGLTPDAEYDEVRTHLREAETLTLITDGVLEARNRKGELYGFERVAELMREKPTASQIAEAACSFGQDDDITVISIALEAHREPQPLRSLYALPVLE